MRLWLAIKSIAGEPDGCAVLTVRPLFLLWGSMGFSTVCTALYGLLARHHG